MADPIFQGIDLLTPAQRVSLKRSAGKLLSEADANTLQAFFTAANYVEERNTEKAFAAICIACLWSKEESVNPIPFAKSAGKLRASKPQDNRNGLDSRFHNLIDTDWIDRDGFLISKLARLAKMMKSSDMPCPDPEDIYTSLNGWNHPDRYIQRRWMKDYLYPEPKETENKEEK